MNFYGLLSQLASHGLYSVKTIASGRKSKNK